MQLIREIVGLFIKIVVLLKDLVVLVVHHIFPDGVVHLNWEILTIGILIIFAVIGFKKGWQYALATLAAHFFAWGITTEATLYLIRVASAITERPITGRTNDFFPIIVYLLLVVMVMVVLSKFIETKGPPKQGNQKVASLTMGALSGYFFLVLLLDIGRQWIANQFTAIDPLVNLQVSVHDLFSLTISSDFTNNPYTAYEELLTVESLILLLLLVVFWNRLIWSFLTWVDKNLLRR